VTSPAKENTAMSRTYPGSLAAGLLLSFTGLPLLAAGLFDSQPLDEERFAVLAQAVGSDSWKLLVLEQIKTRPLCWEERADGLVKPSLNDFDFSGICSRYLDSNGYSLRAGGEDMARSFRLRLQQDRDDLVLMAIDPDQGVPIPVARANRPRRDRDAFVKLNLDPGWSLERRAYQGRTLSHVYFAHQNSTPQLLAKARGGEPPQRVQGLGRPTAPGAPQLISRGSSLQGRGPIRLEVIPYRP
jgi:hypothetical protein